MMSFEEFAQDERIDYFIIEMALPDERVVYSATISGPGG